MSNNNEDSNNNTQPRTTTKEEAIRLLSKGIGVIPLQNPEEPIRFNGETDEDFAKSRRSELDRRKQPAIKWTPYKTRLATIEEANNWFTFNPNYNLAIVCGDVSGGLIAVDVDGGKAKKQIEDKFPAMSEGLRKVLNSTMGNVTGSGGLHFVFYVEGGKTDISQLTIWLSDEKHSEIKIQGNYHYIASAPSRSPHNNGKLYESNGKDIAVITLEQLNEFIQTVGLPELVNKKQSVDPAARQESDDDDDDKASKTNSSNQVMAELEGTRALTPEQMQQLLDEVMACYDEGRNEVIYTLPAAMRKEGLTYDTTREFVILVGKTANDSSRDRDRSLDKVDRTYSKAIEEIKGKSGLKEYLVGAFGQDGLERFSRICQIINNPDFSRDALVEAVKEEKKRGGWEDGNGNGNGEAHQDDDDDDDSTTPGAWLKRQKERDTALDVIGALRDEILRKDRFITIKATIKEKNEIRVYRNGTYEPGGEDRINELTVTLGGSHASTHVLNEVVRLIRFDERRRMDLSAFHSDINLITVGNGLLDIFTWELKDHTPDHLSTFKYPMDYDAEADCPTTEKFLTDVIAEPHKLREFLKFWAYILLKDCRYEKAAMFVGGGANGKGKLIMLMEAQEGGWDRCSHISLHDLGDDRFATAGLHDKTLNTVAD